MNEGKTEYSQLEDEYLDCLIKLAYDLDDLEKEQQITEEAEGSASKPDELLVRRTWQMLQQKMDRLEQEEKRKKRRETVRRTIPQILKAAACILLVIAIGAPVVIASSKEIRSKVIQMLVNIDQENNVAYFGLEENEDASFAVPAEWDGAYFMSWIPEGMEQIDYDADFTQIKYADAPENDSDRRFISFTEQDRSSDAVLFNDIELVIREIKINDRPAYISEDSSDHSVCIYWQNDERMFSLLTGNLTADEALKIAQNVRKIIE